MIESPPYKPSVGSRGIPAKESFWFPPFNAPEVRDFQDSNENPTRNLWTLEEVMLFVFPKKFQRRYHEVALELMVAVLKKGMLTGDDTAELTRSAGISKATLYNKVLPRLRRVGMLKIKRRTIVAIQSRRKYRPMQIFPSKTFGNYLMKIGDSWQAIVDDARSRRKQEEQSRTDLGWTALEVKARGGLR